MKGLEWRMNSYAENLDVGLRGRVVGEQGVAVVVKRVDVAHECVTEGPDFKANIRYRLQTKQG